MTSPELPCALLRRRRHEYDGACRATCRVQLHRLVATPSPGSAFAFPKSIAPQPSTATSSVGSSSASNQKVSQLGGKVLDRDSMGPYQVCDCLDDQGTAFGLWYDPFRPAP
jgi:hypothetical protein